MLKASDKREFNIPSQLPVLPVRDIIVFPFMVLPLFVGRQKSIAAIEASLAHDRLILLVAQRDVAEETPGTADLYEVGTVAMVMRMLKQPDGRVKILVQGLGKARLNGLNAESPHLNADVEPLSETPPVRISLETEAMMRAIRTQLTQAVDLGLSLSEEVLPILDTMDDPGNLADLVASHIGLELSEAQQILEITDPLERLQEVEQILARELEVLTVQDRILSLAREEMGKNQRDYILREQMKAIQSELGESEIRTEEIRELRQKMQKAGLSEEARQECDKQLKRLETMPPEAAEYSMLRSYIDWLVDLPWSRQSRDRLDLKKARRVLEEDHFGLEQVKERILEYLAVRKLKKEMKGPILCFVGPPGVGKTSLGKSIARTMGREFVRISLGGLRDEAEIRGHRRTYIGALPGRILQGIKQAGTRNPVFMIDELDKVGADFRGDPSAALLEVLDPEQNHAFSDHYLNLPFDLSNVLFIATANLMDTIPAALRDRMEVIRLAGYSAEEKQKIAERYLIPRQIAENGLKEKQIHLSRQAVMKIITEYTSEAGLRNLEREIGGICRKVARRFAEGNKTAARITAGSVAGYIGPPPFLPEEERTENEIGVATGLAWTQAGGEVLHVEASTMKGKGELTLTGHLGEVMKESVRAALSYARSHARELKIDEDIFDKLSIHVHVPAGAIPKDGPSAGVTMATALISALSQQPVRKDVAMTGEVTLRGKVLPVGGIKEKVLAALRSEIKTVILPSRSAQELEKIPSRLRRKIQFVPASTMGEVLQAALDAKNETR